jgi:glycine dehydrogenase subunit 1
MPYIPNTDNDRRLMLEKIGVKSFDELLIPVPQNVRLNKLLDLPAPLSEMDLLREMEIISRKNKSELAIFAGGGVYDHFIPSAVGTILSRPEFVTAYTPYQAEVAQGTLQAIYEFQTHICRLTGMDIANASMYDGASAAAEAVHLAINHTKRNRILISETINPLFRDVIKTYLSGLKIEIVIVPSRDGLTDYDRLKELIGDSIAGVVLSQPNFFGLIENVEVVAEMIHRVGGLMITAVDPISAALLKSPAECGADIAIGEGQPLGIPLNFGGPLLGFFAAKRELMRLLPGRIVARTVDEAGNPGFVLTLQTREQHIRREKATSNICTNQALCATTATVYLSLLGKVGLKRVALLSMEKTHKAVSAISMIVGYKPYFAGNYIREIAIKTPVPAKNIIENCINKHEVLPGIDLGRFYPNMKDGLLMAVTEKRTDEEINMLVKSLKDF